MTLNETERLLELSAPLVLIPAIYFTIQYLLAFSLVWAAQRANIRRSMGDPAARCKYYALASFLVWAAIR